MLTMPRRRLSWMWAALALVVGAPAVSEAQLLPNLPIRRQRAACATEPPVYRTYRHEYYGYHPTCWRPFPEGWGCPSSAAAGEEAVKARQEVDAQIKQQQSTTTQPEGAPPPEGEMPRPRPESDLPQLPTQERSPFRLDDSTPRSGQPRGGTTLPQPEGVPPTAPPPDTNPSAATTPPVTPPETSSLDFPVDRPGVSSAARANSMLDVGHPSSPSVAASAAELMPYPAMPQPAAPGAVTGNRMDPTAPPPIVQAPQRRGPISGLFQRLTSIWR